MKPNVAVLAALAVLVLATAPIQATTYLGQNFTVSSFPAGWEANFDSQVIDGAWETTKGWLGVGFYGLPATTDAILEKHFPRASGDTTSYVAQLAMSGHGWHKMYHVHYLAYSLDNGATWIRVGSDTRDSYTTETIGGAVIVPPDASLWVRYCAVDCGDWTATLPASGFYGGGSAITQVSVKFGAGFQMGTDFSKTDFQTGWESDFSSTQINGGFLPAGVLRVGFGGIPPGPIDAVLERVYLRPSGDTNPYVVKLSQKFERANRYHQNYIKYSMDGGTTWKTVGPTTSSDWPAVTISAEAYVPSSAGMLIVQNGVVDNGDWSVGLLGDGGGSHIISVAADFCVASTMGDDFYKSDWTEPTWRSDFQRILGEGQQGGSGSWTGNGSYLSYNEGGQPALENLGMAKYYVRAEGDNNIYVLNSTTSAGRWDRVRDNMTSLTTDGATWNVLDRQTIDTWWPTNELVAGTTTIDSSAPFLGVRREITYFDPPQSTDWASDAQRISWVGDDFKAIHPIVVFSSYTDELSSRRNLWSNAGDVTPWTALGGSDRAGLYSDGGWNYVGYRFDRSAGTTGGIKVDLSTNVYVESIDFDNETFALWYSWDGTTWTQLDKATAADVGVVWTTLAGSVTMDGAKNSLYVAVGGPTAAGGPAWMGYIDRVSASFGTPPIGLGGAKNLADGTPVAINSLVVTHGGFADFFYAQSETERSGIRVEKIAHGRVLNEKVSVTGYMRTKPYGEKYVEATGVVHLGTGAIEPTGMINKNVGGGPCFYDPDTKAGVRGYANSGGANNQGLLVKIWGIPTYTGSYSVFTIDDGSGNVIPCYDPMNNAWGAEGWLYVAVTGVVSVDHVDEAGNMYPLLTVRETLADLQGIQ